jgi:hypothetical protein
MACQSSLVSSQPQWHPRSSCAPKCCDPYIAWQRCSFAAEGWTFGARISHGMSFRDISWYLQTTRPVNSRIAVAIQVLGCLGCISSLSVSLPLLAKAKHTVFLMVPCWQGKPRKWGEIHSIWMIMEKAIVHASVPHICFKLPPQNHSKSINWCEEIAMKIMKIRHTGQRSIHRILLCMSQKKGNRSGLRSQNTETCEFMRSSVARTLPGNKYRAVAATGHVCCLSSPGSKWCQFGHPHDEQC